ncbi:hypothetical protein AU14_18375 [Marinobacter similis]|uniref:Uncharacterized protein n=1 Tax=Marinobacter similis TaxID=1420916 RepID=W5YN06_9GAMM|nr:hypothetical protein AU14_18375 [Marinobacter similis]
MRTDQSGMLKGNDQTNAHVLLATACDGTLATTAQFISIRVVCSNTLAVALKGSTANAVKVKEEGVDQAALGAAAARGFGNALFKYDEDEMGQVVEEFYPNESSKEMNSSPISMPTIQRGLKNGKLKIG